MIELTNKLGYKRTPLKQHLARCRRGEVIITSTYGPNSRHDMRPSLFGDLHPKVLISKLLCQLLIHVVDNLPLSLNGLQFSVLELTT